MEEGREGGGKERKQQANRQADKQATRAKCKKKNPLQKQAI